jgi:hypothetical protein
MKKGVAEHVAVLRALSRRSPAEAEKCMRAHNAASRSRVDATFKTNLAGKHEAAPAAPGLRSSRLRRKTRPRS